MCCSPEEPDQRSVYGESRGVSPVFLRPKLKAAVRRAPTVPPELRAEEDREEVRGGGQQDIWALSSRGGNRGQLPPSPLTHQLDPPPP